LYREVILDHFKHSAHAGDLPGADRTAEGNNTLCGDELALYVRLRDGRVADVRFEGRGCSISQASASMMTEAIKGKTIEDVRRLVTEFKGMMHGQEPAEDLGDLVALQGVRKFPVRIKCATLSWVAVEQGLAEHATTEAER